VSRWLGNIIVPELGEDEVAYWEAAQEIIGPWMFEWDGERPLGPCECAIAPEQQEIDLEAQTALESHFETLSKSGPELDLAGTFDEVTRLYNARNVQLRKALASARPSPSCSECGGNGRARQPYGRIEYGAPLEVPSWDRLLVRRCTVADTWPLPFNLEYPFVEKGFRAPAVTRTAAADALPLVPTTAQVLAAAENGFVAEAFVVFTPDGAWHDREAELLDTASWHRRLLELYRSHPAHRVVPAEFHE
jgi:hypothetical protein